MPKEESEAEFDRPTTQKKPRRIKERGFGKEDKKKKTPRGKPASKEDRAAYRDASPTRRAARKALRKGETTSRDLASFMSPKEEASEMARIEKEGIADLHSLLPGQLAKAKSRQESVAMIDPQDEAELMAAPVQDVVTADERNMASFGGPTPGEEQAFIDEPFEVFDPRAARESAAKTALASATEPGDLDVSAEDPSMFAEEEVAPSEPQIVKGAGEYDYQMDPATNEITIVSAPEGKEHLVNMKLSQGKAYDKILSQEFGGLA